MSDIEAFGRILDLLYEAALDNDRLPAASALIDETLRIHGNTIGFGGMDPENGALVYSLTAFARGQRCYALEREYLESYFHIDERVPRLHQCPEGRLTHLSELYSRKESRSSVVFNEHLSRVPACNSVMVRLGGFGGSSICWTAHDPLAGADWSSIQLEFMERLVPHFRRYARIRQTLAEAGAHGLPLTQLLDATGLGVILLDPRGRVLETNDTAREVLRMGDALFDARGLLYATNPDDNVHLQGLLSRALPPSGTQGAGGSAVLRRVTGLPLLFHAKPLIRRETELLSKPAAALGLVVGSAESDAHLRGHGGIGPQPDESGEPGGGAADRGLERSRDRLGDGPRGRYGPHPCEEHAGQARPVETGGSGRLVLSLVDTAE